MADRDRRYLLLQARKMSDPSREDEQLAFAHRLGVGPEQIQTWDILKSAPDLQALQDVDALLVGGAGEFSVVDPIPQVDALIRFLARVAERNFPTFASCFGFQALAVGLGGTVIHDEPNAEVGTYRVGLTQAGTEDPLFSGLPSEFLVQMGHGDRVERLPEGAVSLADNERAPCQALKVEGTQVYATQFHPELTHQNNIERFKRYYDYYGNLFGEEEARRRLDSHRPSPEANALLRRFVTLCVEN